MNDIPTDLLKGISAHGATVSDAREIDHATQYRLVRGPESATLNVYDTGRVLEGGKESALKALLRDWRLSRQKRKSGSKREVKPSPAPFPRSFTIPNATPRVGTDEAGKGEYLGPLVVAGTRVAGKREDEKLRGMGVRDSKELSLAKVRQLAGEVTACLGPENVHVVCLPPREYERRRDAAGRNVNRLLGEINVEIISKLRDEVEVAVVDAFGVKAREYIEDGLTGGPRVEARSGAEDDAAVAAASILARARYLEEMDALSENVGFELPRGSSNVIGAARRVYEESGEEGLREVAKFHFATTERVIETAKQGGSR